jgi:hypothetical protein
MLARHGVAHTYLPDARPDRPGGGEECPQHTAHRTPQRGQALKMLDTAMGRQQYQQDSLIEVLHKAQELFGYLDNDVLFYVARASSCLPARSTAWRRSTICSLSNLLAFTRASCAWGPPASSRGR